MAGEFMQKLREAIMPLHKEAEEVGPMRAIAQKSVTLEQYKRILERLYGFVSVSEDAIFGQAYSIGLDLEQRSRKNHLETDLLFLGKTRATLDQIPICGSLPSTITIHEALGLMYLSEGSRLGGLTLSIALEETFGFVDHQGYAYFASNGINVPTLWLSFRDFLEDYVRTKGGESEIIIAARHGFSVLNQWLSGL